MTILSFIFKIAYYIVFYEGVYDSICLLHASVSLTACSQIEHYLETLHDRRRFMDGLFTTRKHRVEQCLALCLLYQVIENFDALLN